MVKVEFFKPSDLSGFVFREEDKLDNVLGCNNIDDFIQYCESNITYTVRAKNGVIAIVGAIEVQRGNFYIWQTPCAEFKDNLFSFTRGLRLCTEKFIRENKCHRLYTICKDEDRFINWMTKGVGFNFECLLEAFGPNRENMLQFKKVVR